MWGWLETWITLAIVLVVGFGMLRDRVRGMHAAFAGGRRERRASRSYSGTLVPNTQHLTPNPQSLFPIPYQGIDAAERERPRISEVVPFGAWWPDVVKHNAHVMIVGETRSGKSTTARALLAWRAGTDAIVILDPHAKFSDWGGLEAIGNGRDFEAIGRAMSAIDQEFRRRFAVGEEIGDPLTVFIDEYPAIAAHVPHAAALVKTWLREAAKAKIRLVFLTQDSSVKALGVEGEGAVRLNMWSILLGSFAAKASPVAAACERPAVLQRLALTQAVSVKALSFESDVPIDPSVLWQMPIPEPVPALPAPLESALEPVPASEPVPEPGAEPGTLGEKRALAVRKALASGMSRNDVALLIGGNRGAALAMIREAAGE